jgi:signal transduction histidine kinase
MTHRETDVDRLTSLLGQCLGRIDEQAYRVQQLGDECDDETAAQTFEEAAATLQELIGSLMSAESQQSPDAAVEPVLRRAIDQLIGELGVPIVVRQRIAGGLPKVACSPGQLAFALQRALMLAVTAMQAGAEVSIEARVDADQVLVEIESQCPGGIRDLSDRSRTLREFATELRGNCLCDTDGHGNILIALELPVALVTEG